MYNRSPYVHEVISRIKAQSSQELKGIVSTQEVRRLCGLIRAMMKMNLMPADREKLETYTRLLRCFTVAEANHICTMHSFYMRERNQQHNELGVKP